MALIQIVCPAPPHSRQGNRITALRWAETLRGLGHRVRISSTDEAVEADLLVALHARRSADAVRRFRRRHPDRPIVVALTGTDLYRDLRTSAAARRSLDWADRLILLQPAGARALPVTVRRKARVIYQSVDPLGLRADAPDGEFRVCVLAHLRPVKNPLLTARAVRTVPAISRLHVLHAGRALTPAMTVRAQREMARNRRYRWLGELPHRRALALLARSHLLVLSSRLEGGANVIGEAAVLGVPIVATAVDGTVGLLGRGYPGLFPAGDRAALRDLLARAECDPAFYARLRRATKQAAPRFARARERRAWRELLKELLGRL